MTAERRRGGRRRAPGSIAAVALLALAWIASVSAPASASTSASESTPAPVSASTPAPTSAQELTIEYVAHACFRLQSASGASVLIDPYASRVWLGYDFPEGVRADAVLITHPHYDHDAGQRRGRPFPWPGTRVLTEPGEYRVGDIRVVGVRGKHADPYGEEFGQKNTVFVVEVDGIRLAHIGDNGPLSPETLRGMGRVDVLMMPIDGDYHILAADQIEQILADVRPRMLVPMHYRIEELESDPGSPDDLGEIDPWLEGREEVERLDGHRLTLRPEDLSRPPRIVVFRHSPEVPLPGRVRR